jgi:hypothetical protein
MHILVHQSCLILKVLGLLFYQYHRLVDQLIFQIVSWYFAFLREYLLITLQAIPSQFQVLTLLLSSWHQLFFSTLCFHSTGRKVNLWLKQVLKLDYVPMLRYESLLVVWNVYQPIWFPISSYHHPIFDTYYVNLKLHF